MRKLLKKSVVLHYITVAVTFTAILAGCSKDFNDIKENVHGDERADVFRSALHQPNVILFVADDLGYEVPHFTGGQSYNTPNLDFMANNGVHFSETYMHPDGFPSRLALLTGKYSFRNYVTWGLLPANEKTIGNLMEDAGYATCFVGKWQCGDGDVRIKGAGFQNYLVYLPFRGLNQREGRYKNPSLYANGDYLPASETKGKYSEDMLSDYLCNFISENKNQPFFGLYSFNLVGRTLCSIARSSRLCQLGPPRRSKKR